MSNQNGYGFEIPGNADRGQNNYDQFDDDKEGSYKRLLGDKEITWFWLMQHYSKENAAAYKRQKEAKKNGKGKKVVTTEQSGQGSGQQGGYGSCQGQTGFDQGQTGIGQGQPGFSQGQLGFSQGQPGFSQGQQGFGQSQQGFSQGQPGFGQGQQFFGEQGGYNEENFGSTIVLDGKMNMFADPSGQQGFNQGQANYGQVRYQQGFGQQQSGFGQQGFGQQQSGFGQQGFGQQQSGFGQQQSGFGQQGFSQGQFGGGGQPFFQEDEYQETSIVEEDEYQGTSLLEQPSAVPTLTRVSNGSTIQVTKIPFILGRRPKVADYLFSENTNVSGKHATIGSFEGIYYIEDNQSRNGVFLNGYKIEPGEKIQLVEGMEIMLGDEKLIFHE